MMLTKTITSGVKRAVSDVCEVLHSALNMFDDLEWQGPFQSGGAYQRIAEIALKQITSARRVEAMLFRLAEQADWEG